MTDPISKQLGFYQIVDQIGAGGMATVYRAYEKACDLLSGRCLADRRGCGLAALDDGRAQA